MKKTVSLIGILAISWFLVNNPWADTYVSTLQENAVSVTATNSLYTTISEKAKDYEKKPIDAKLDPVWKAIPGLNGVTVDIDASYKNMKKEKKFNEQRLVFKQVKPKITLNDLPPAPIYKGNPEKEMVSFIINVAWGNEFLPDILSTLKKHHVKASFFLEGRWVQKNPDLAKMIAEAGHELGNHSYTHPDMSKISSSKIHEEIVKTNDVIEATTGKQVTLLAPPSGYFNNEVVKIAAQQKLKTVIWSVDTIDWQKPSPDTLLKRVTGKIHNGALILMHPTEVTTNSLEHLIIEIKNKGYKIDTVSDMLSEERESIKTKK
ncbi:polysaccharide deacetylase family protein [Bacillus circulans]|uniref:polysaccharide deacetylase family protein n=1 Tax=Niallia TaxID=2837506 RepID=UPI0013D7E91E|nr:polysaccharide deacetylase family protein [Niallia circulans]NRG26959.1 polysaccharide deacetylase family protein [Niallia circulans]QJX61952.1 polysaccharide deacetylase family protein [Niallia circulans]